SLRADQERAAALEASLEEKRDVIQQLEASINRHSNTITELKRGAEGWKRKYQALKGASSTATVPALSETDIRSIEQLDKTAIEQLQKTAIEQLEKTMEPKGDATIAIDM